MPWGAVATLTKILLGYVQCMSVFSTLDFVRWPKVFLDFLHVLESFDLIRVWQLLAPDCVAGRSLGFYFKFAIALSCVP